MPDWRWAGRTLFSCFVFALLATYVLRATKLIPPDATVPTAAAASPALLLVCWIMRLRGEARWREYRLLEDAESASNP